jgi:Tfp pilus assembly protein PilV
MPSTLFKAPSPFLESGLIKTGVGKSVSGLEHPLPEPGRLPMILSSPLPPRPAAIHSPFESPFEVAIMSELKTAGPQNQVSPSANPSHTIADPSSAGFSLIEALVALMVLATGLLAAGQLIYIAFSSASLSRSKGTAAIAAQSKLQFLSDQYRRDPLAPDLNDGDHGGEQVKIVNPLDNSTLNLYAVSWHVSAVSDPRPGKTLKAKYIVVTVKPIQPAGRDNLKAGLNKVVSLATISSPGLEK